MSVGSDRALWPSRDYRLRAGAKLGSYRILSPLGAGGMAEVYLAEHVFMSRTAAIKIMQVERESRDDLMDRFKAEIELLAQIDHDNVVKVYEASMTDEGMVWMAMEHLCGRTMLDVIYDERPAVPTALDLLAQAADGLDAAHRVGAVHRDIKPENVFVTDDDIVKVLDFGIAKLVDRGVPRRHAVKTTVREKQLGTIAYMSPEQLVGDRKLDRRTDVWSLGVVAYELLAGRYPFSQTDGELPPIDLLGFFILRPDQQPPLPSRFNAAVSTEASAIVMRCLAKEPKGRFATMAELAKTLRRERDRLSANEGKTAAPIPTPALAPAQATGVVSKQTIKMSGADQARASAARFTSATAPREAAPRKATLRMTPVAEHQESTGGKAALARPADAPTHAMPARSTWQMPALAIGTTAIAVTMLGWLVLSRFGESGAAAANAASSEPVSPSARVESDASNRVSALGPVGAPVVASAMPSASTSSSASVSASAEAPASPPHAPAETPKPSIQKKPPVPSPSPKPKHDARLF